MSELSIFLLVSVAEQAGLNLAMPETKKSINLWVAVLCVLCTEGSSTMS